MSYLILQNSFLAFLFLLNPRKCFLHGCMFLLLSCAYPCRLSFNITALSARLTSVTLTWNQLLLMDVVMKWFLFLGRIGGYKEKEPCAKKRKLISLCWFSDVPCSIWLVLLHMIPCWQSPDCNPRVCLFKDCFNCLRTFVVLF